MQFGCIEFTRLKFAAVGYPGCCAFGDGTKWHILMLATRMKCSVVPTQSTYSIQRDLSSRSTVWVVHDQLGTSITRDLVY